MPYLTLTEISKAATKPWFSASCVIQPGNGASVWGQHAHTYLLTYLLVPDRHWAPYNCQLRKYTQDNKARIQNDIVLKTNQHKISLILLFDLFCLFLIVLW